MMTDMTCARCQHWKSDSDNQEWEASRAGFGECLGVRERWRIMDEASRGIEWSSANDEAQDGGELAADSYTGARIAALKAARAYVQDGSEYRAELYTAPDFFCALFAEKVRPPNP